VTNVIYFGRGGETGNVKLNMKKEKARIFMNAGFEPS
jgi:hypothetical protein